MYLMWPTGRLAGKRDLVVCFCWTNGGLHGGGANCRPHRISRGALRNCWPLAWPRQVTAVSSDYLRIVLWAVLVCPSRVRQVWKPALDVLMFSKKNKNKTNPCFLFSTIMLALTGPICQIRSVWSMEENSWETTVILFLISPSCPSSSSWALTPLQWLWKSSKRAVISQQR